MKIAIVVQGRFHAFDLAKALLARGHDVTVFTNYPKWAIKRFNLDVNRVRTFPLHGLLSKLAFRFSRYTPWLEPERFLNPMFGRWAARQLAKEQWDVIHAWSGVSEEIVSRPDTGTLKMIMRGSAHIRAQSRILEQEEQRTSFPVDRPGPWIMAREEREYKQADRIVVLSGFARASFVQAGFTVSKLRCLPLGANLANFRPDQEVIDARCRRILSGMPLHVLFVGAVTPRKGLLDISEVVHSLSRHNMRFRFVGPVTSDAKGVVGKMRPLAEFIPKQPQSRLPESYAWGDVFLFPTLEDGFAVVLAQAQASGLPILTTTNCSGPDLVREGETGWILPIRDPEAFIDRLLWCDTHREELAHMVRNSYDNFRARDWADVAADFETLCERELSLQRAELATAHGH
jgi:glycosyltransferase involved in cell wall biosynthesis